MCLMQVFGFVKVLRGCLLHACNLCFSEITCNNPAQNFLIAELRHQVLDDHALKSSIIDSDCQHISTYLMVAKLLSAFLG